MALLALYIIAAPGLFLLGPLGGLLAVGRPASVREWFWLVLAMVWCGAFLSAGGALAEQVVRAAGVLLTGAFLVLTLRTAWPPFVRAAAAVGAAGVALAGWMAALGISAAALRDEVARSLAAIFEAQAQQAAALGGDMSGQAVTMFRQMARDADGLAGLLPGTLALAALAGLMLAWAWYERLAARPIGMPAGPFARFTFSDHAVWAVIGGLAPVVASLFVAVPAGLRTAGANVLLVAAALFAARGAAVMRGTIGRVPWPVVLAVAVVTVILFSFVLGGLVLLGLADVWVDFRRRARAGGGEGVR